MTESERVGPGVLKPSANPLPLLEEVSWKMDGHAMLATKRSAGVALVGEFHLSIAKSTCRDPRQYLLQTN